MMFAASIGTWPALMQRMSSISRPGSEAPLERRESWRRCRSMRLETGAPSSFDQFTRAGPERGGPAEFPGDETWASSRAIVAAIFSRHEPLAPRARDCVLRNESATSNGAPNRAHVSPGGSSACWSPTRAGTAQCVHAPLTDFARRRPPQHEAVLIGSNRQMSGSGGTCRHGRSAPGSERSSRIDGPSRDAAACCLHRRLALCPVSSSR